MTDLTSIRNTLQEKREEIIADLSVIATFNEETGDWEATPVIEVSEADPNNEADGVEEWNERNATVSLLEAMFRNHNRALEKIEGVSKNLSDLIQDISKTAEEQALMSGKITKMMEFIEAIAKQTASGTDTTAESISTLDALVQELHHSVAEFKLPETASYGR